MAGLLVSVATILLTCVLVQGVPNLPSSFEAYWQHELPGVAMPASLRQTASPLSPYTDRVLFAHLLAGSDLGLLSNELCSSAQIYCAQKAVFGGPQPRVCIPPFFNYEYGVIPCEFAAADVAQVAASGIFFRPRGLTPGQVLHFPNTANDLSKVAFLSSSLANALPVNLDHMSELQRLFGVAESSRMELDMANTAVHCSLQSSSHEIKACESSGEGLVRFVTQNLGDKVIAISATASPEQQLKVVEVRPINREDEKTVTCHSMKFPSLVYSCHIVPTTQVFDVAFVELGGQPAHALAVCHSDTSYWNPNHIAFKVLKTEPGDSGICHWLPENTLVFAQRSKV